VQSDDGLFGNLAAQIAKLKDDFCALRLKLSQSTKVRGNTQP
jgi:hypothetical protein